MKLPKYRAWDKIQKSIKRCKKVQKGAKRYKKEFIGNGWKPQGKYWMGKIWGLN